MSTMNQEAITISVQVNAPPDKVWEYWTNPKHITNWYFASDDWHAPDAENDLTNGGRFKTTMAAKDGSMSFDFGGIYSAVEHQKLIEYTLGDGRKVSTTFEPVDDKVLITQIFEPENTNPVEFQRSGWQAILNNFKSYVEQA